MLRKINDTIEIRETKWYNGCERLGKMSIVLNLYKQSLINRKNNAQLAMIQNNAQKIAMLGGLHKNPNYADYDFLSESETDLDLALDNALIEYMAVSSELEALNNANIDYMS